MRKINLNFVPQLGVAWDGVLGEHFVMTAMEGGVWGSAE
jgi:hypothetical protein